MFLLNFGRILNINQPMDQSLPNALNQESLLAGISYLIQIDPDLRKIIDSIGNPPLWSRKPGFPTLIHIILEQQVSLASARAAFDKLSNSAGELTPGRFLEYTDDQLREFGFSRQKTKYGRELAKALLFGDLDLTEFHHLNDSAARHKLTQIKGIGHWTADIYLLMAHLRPDIWPSGDLAISRAVQRIKKLDEKPGPERLNSIAEPWKPWRAVAARILWHFYLSA